MAQQVEQHACRQVKGSLGPDHPYKIYEVRENLSLLYTYISEVVHGKYKDYSTSSLTLALAAIIYVISPLDIMPDLIPFTGYIDDIAIVTWAMTKMEEELKRFKENKEKTM